MSDPNEGKKTLLLELGDALLRNWWTVVAGLCLGLAGAIVALHYMPKRYEATTKVRVVPQSVPEAMLPTTVTEDMSRVLMEVKEAILGREYMLGLIDRAFSRPDSEAEIQSLIRRIQNNVEVRTASQAAVFSLTYNHEDPERAAEVVNELTRVYVEGNLSYRRGEARDTRQMFERLASEAQEEFEQVDAELRDFRARHFLQTEGSLDANSSMLSRRQDELSRLEGDRAYALRELEDLRSRLQRERASRSPGDPDLAPSDPVAARIARARQELEDLRSRYSDRHPDVARKERELAELLSRAQGESGAGSQSGAEGGTAATAGLSETEERIAAVERRLAQLNSQRERLRNELSRIERRIEATGGIQSDLNTLEERHRVLEARYKDYKSKAEASRNAEFIEETDKGQRLEVIEWAVVPFRPVFPDPMQVKLLGVGIGFLLFVGPLLLNRYLNPLVSSEAGLRALIDVPVLVSIPRIPTPSNAGAGRRMVLKNVSIALLCSLGLAAVFVVWR